MRHKVVRVLAGAAAATFVVAGVAGCQDSGSDNNAGGASGECAGQIAIMGAITGSNSGLFLPSVQSAKMAIEQFNTKENCKVEPVEFDTTGSPTQAPQVAEQIVGKPAILAVIGGGFSGETKATMNKFAAGNVAMVSPSATAIELSEAGNSAFHRVVGHDGVQGAAAAGYLKDTLQAKKVFIVDDSSTYGAGISGELKKGLGALVAGEDKVQEKQSNFAATVSKVKSAGADVVAYAGYTNEATPFIKQLRSAGVTAKFVGFDGLYDANFAKGGAKDAEGAIVTCPCLPATKAGGTFSADFKSKYGADPGAYGAEGYDAAMILLEGIKAGNTDRAKLSEWVDKYDKAGVSKHLKFDEKGDIDRSKVVVWAYEVKGGKFEPLTDIKLS
ncbi:branched-chain amino acid ABC transporter substrate-binding protein [Pilimelia columellifera]|uniref:Branched-chain amino acid ABC transporter substrate-binding protein n=1 Tax=Pilimelia columellifera subsp. columellifera TaxID=706583 RepID=A0ABN3N8Z3_9ACTN